MTLQFFLRIKLIYQNILWKVLSDNIKLECENDNNELFEKNIKQELIKYLIENLNIIDLIFIQKWIEFN